MWVTSIQLNTPLFYHQMKSYHPHMIREPPFATVYVNHDDAATKLYTSATKPTTSAKKVKKKDAVVKMDMASENVTIRWTRYQEEPPTPTVKLKKKGSKKKKIRCCVH